MIFKTFQVRGNSTGGKGAAPFDIGGFIYPGTVYLALIGWSVKYDSGHHSVEEVGIWSQRAIPGGYAWANEFPVENDGHIRGQFIGFINDDNDDNPFSFLVNALAIQA